MKTSTPFKLFTDDRGGNLLPVEFANVDFVPLRVFVVNDVPKDAIRGEHAHYKTKQLLVCVRGSILVGLDDGTTTTEMILTEGESAYIDLFVCDYQQFLTENAIMMVLASTEYDASDYINDKIEFYNIVRNRK